MEEYFQEVIEIQNFEDKEEGRENKEKETIREQIVLKIPSDANTVEKWLDDRQISISLITAFGNVAVKSIPSIIAMIIEYSMFSLNIIFVGFLNDPVAMSGCGLGGMTANILVFSFGVGMCGGIDTLVSQAYGRKDYDLCKVYLNVSRIIMALLFIPQVILLCFSEDLFILIGQPEESAKVASKYLMICLPGLFFNTQFECIRRYLLAIGVYYPTMCILSANFVAHVCNLYLFVLILDFGILGVGIATSITYALNFVMLTLYCQFQSDTKIKASWNLLNPMILKCTPEFLRYGLPSCVALLLYWFPYELTVVYGGWLGLDQSAGSTILNSLIMFLSEVPYGIAMTASGIIGFNLGANLPNKARVCTISTFMLASLSSLFICVVLYTLKDEIIQTYTKDEEVIKVIESSMIEFTIVLFIDLFNCCVNGVLRGMGYQKSLVIFCLISFWVVTLPITLNLIFLFDFNFKGIWIGLIAGNLVFCILNNLATFFTNWDELSLKASKKGSENEKIAEP